MKHVSFLMVLVAAIWIIFPYSALAEEAEKVIVISEKVGEVIDAEERERFGLWPGIEGFKSATFFQLPDGSYVVEVVFEKDGKEIVARTPQSEISIESLRTYIEKVSKGEITPVFLEDIGKTEEEKYEVSVKDEHVVISELVGGSIDREESEEYDLFTNIPDFEQAIFYTRKGSGFMLEIETKEAILTSVVMEENLSLILSEYIEMHSEILVDLKPLEKKWKILGYDGQGIPITDAEAAKFYRKGSGCTLGCCLGGGTVGLITGWAFMIGQAMSNVDKESSIVPAFVGPAIGSLLGAAIGNFIAERKIDRKGAVLKIKELRRPQ